MGSMQKKPDNNVLGHNVWSRIRQTHQHFIFRKMFGYLVHPSIPRNESMQIADIGTGSGIWVLDAASDFPASCSFQGLDMNLASVPPKAWLPANIQFSEVDIEQDLPAHLEGKFDVVNVRLFLLAVRNDDPSWILRAAVKMLKPGGWLQWVEADNERGYLDFTKATPNLTGSAMREMHETIIPRDERFRPSWPLKLPEFFKANGFEDLTVDTRNNKDILPWLTSINDTVTATYDVIIQSMPAGDAKSRFEELYGRAVQESWEGTAWNPTRINVVGRKPLAA